MSFKLLPVCLKAWKSQWNNGPWKNGTMEYQENTWELLFQRKNYILSDMDLVLYCFELLVLVDWLPYKGRSEALDHGHSRWRFFKGLLYSKQLQQYEHPSRHTIHLLTMKQEVLALAVVISHGTITCKDDNQEPILWQGHPETCTSTNDERVSHCRRSCKPRRLKTWDNGEDMGF